MKQVQRTRVITSTVLALLVTHATSLLVLGPNATGSLLSDLIQAILGFLLVFAAVQAARRSTGIARSFWQLTSVAYGLWMIPQCLSAYGDLFDTPDALQSVIKFLFSFWLVPVSIALCLDDDSQTGKIDWLSLLDCCQAVLFVVGAYWFFHFDPGFQSTLARSGWGAYFLYYGLLAAAFQLRAFLTRSLGAKVLFSRAAYFLLFSALVDAVYYYGSASLLQTGAWFDIFWSILLALPLLFASSWQDPQGTNWDSMNSTQTAGQLFGRVPSFVFPVLILIFSVAIGRASIPLALALVLGSFACSSVKHLLTQYRLIVAQEALRRQASVDGLTGVWNRAGILEILKREMLRAERDGKPIGLILIDADHFKVVNDTFGHRGGDIVLQTLVEQFATNLRPYDSLGRYGGEEFLVVAPGCNLQDTFDLAQRIRSHIAALRIPFEHSHIAVTVSLGVASHHSGLSLEALIRAADISLYDAKRLGRNRVEPSAREKLAGQRYSAVALA